MIGVSWVSLQVSGAGVGGTDVLGGSGVGIGAKNVGVASVRVGVGGANMGIKAAIGVGADVVVGLGAGT